MGIRAGAFVVLPSVELQGSFDDNVFATSSSTHSDVFLTVRPRLNIQSDWNQNAVGLKAEGIFQRYTTYSTLDNDQYSVDGQGLLNIYHDLTVSGEVVQARTLIPRTSDAYAQESITPLLYDDTAATLTAIKSFNILRLRATGSFADLRYQDGLTPKGLRLDQSFQNRRSFIGSLRADVATSAAVALFLQETVGHSVLDSYLRNHDETETLVGTNFQVAHLVTAEAGVGYLTSSYANPAAKSVGNFTARALISYFPTGLLTLRLSARQAVIDSGLTSSPTYLSRMARLEADYELLRNLVIIGGLEANSNRYQVIDRRDLEFGVTVDARYKISHGIAFDLSLAHRQRSSSGAAAGMKFGDDVASFGVIMQK